VTLAAALGSALAVVSCTPPDPKAYLEVVEFETYWVVDSTMGDRVFMAPAARVELRNRSDQDCPAIQATAVFRRVGEEETWGSDFQQVTRSGESLGPGETVVVVVKSDGRYHSDTTPDRFFEHELFVDARVDLFLRVGSSGMVPFAEGVVERHVGSRTAVVTAAPPPP
jgi:hypothetical protein